MPNPENPSDSPEILRKLALQKLDEAAVALARYRVVASRDKGIVAIEEGKTMQRKASVLLKESFAVGSSGTPCRCCGGSGREP